MGVFDDEQPGQWKMFPLVMQDCNEPADAARFTLYADNHVVDRVTCINRSHQQSPGVYASDPSMLKMLIYIQQMVQVWVTNAGQVINVAGSKQKSTGYLVQDRAQEGRSNIQVQCSQAHDEAEFIHG